MIETSGERMAKANGLELCYQTFGDSTAPALILIMGLGTQMIAWDEGFCSSLAEKGFYVIRFDNRDIGRSTRLDAAGVPNILALMGMMAIGRKLNVPYTLRDMAADTIGLMDNLGIDQAHVAGASMGGAIVQELAIHHPNRLKSITCIMASPGDPRLKAPTASAIGVLLKTMPTDRDGYLTSYKATVRVLRGPHFPEEEAGDEARAMRNFERGLNPAGTTRQLAAIYASGNRTAALGKITTPALVIHGDADPLIPVAHGHALVKAIGRATVDIIPNMAHALPRAIWPRVVDDIVKHARAV
jgi:pimeloyl-ACP methyl ester carboxylesterase